MENKSLIASSNDNVGKQNKKAFVYPVATVFISTVLILGLSFYCGELWGSHRARDDASIPIDEYCDQTSDCVIPPGLSQPALCYCKRSDGMGDKPCKCQSGQPGASCDETSNCVIPPGLEHPVCLERECQSGQSGALCGVTSDCVTPPDLDHPVCRKGRCQRGAHGDYCGNGSDCNSGFCRPVGRCGGNT